MKRLLTLLLAFAMVLSLAACGEPAANNTPTEPQVPDTNVEPEPIAADVYAEAVEKLNSMTNLRLVIDVSQQTKVGQQTILETQEIKLKLNNIGAEDFAAQMSAVINYGAESAVKTTEIFKDGKVYGELSDYRYWAETTAEEFMEGYAPAALLDASLYGSIEFIDDTTISFTDATAPEAWLVGEGAELIEAAGTAKLDEFGNLTVCTYDVTFRLGSCVFTFATTVEIHENTDQVEIPADVADYTEISDPLIPYLVTRTLGNSWQSRAMSGYMEETVVSAAVQAVFTTTKQVDLFGEGKDLKANVEYDYHMTDLYGNTIWTEEIEEHFTEGTYVYTYDGNAENYSVTSATEIENLRLSFSDQLVSFLPTLENLVDIELTELPGGYLLEYSLSDDYNTILKDYAAGKIMADPSYIDSLASKYDHQEYTGYLAIDGLTGLPTAVSYTYSGAHFIDGVEYALAFQLNQSMDMASLTSYEAVTDEPFPVDPPENPATPLFYHVTGPDGEEMWLMGTIHVGDNRTAHLPQEIYDAFNASDALAVEFNNDAFQEELENDSKLAQKVYGFYMYSDGTTVKDHISDPELYENAVKLMKFAGEYNDYADYFKVSMWAQSLENFYLKLGYNLSSDYGLDNQLMDLAEEKGLPIWDVESGEFQIEMMTSYSDALQEDLLASAVESHPASYYLGVEELFELWCSGDEAALIEYLAPQDTSEMTEEELALYEEYTQAMEWDRNVGMLDVAKGYLSSGKTVFFAVGLAHLIAEDGLVNTLRDAGYTVELVTYQ